MRSLVMTALVVVGCSRSHTDAAHDRPSLAPPPAPAKSTTQLSLEFRRITKHATCRSNERIKVDGQGAVYTAINATDCAPGSVWSTPYPATPRYQLPPDEREELARLVQTSGALDLPALSTDPAKVTTDGYREELEIDLDGRHVVVAVEHTEVAAFSKVRQALVDLAGR
jgi:hypothetical protein